MLTPAELDTACTLLPFLGSRETTLAKRFGEQATRRTLDAGTTVFREGDNCGGLAILVSGDVRVYRSGETGRQITLYRFGAGESCILTANCILSGGHFPAQAVVEETVEAFVVPQGVFRDWVDAFPAWRHWVFTLLGQRLAAVLTVVDEVAFRRLDARVAELLLRRREEAGDQLALTHQQIAAELGSSREVVSRLLADFAAAGDVGLSRGVVEIRHPEALARRARGDGPA